MLQLAVFASGHGSNLEAIYDSIASGSLRGVNLGVVISNNSTSGSLDFAKKKGIAAIHLSLLKCNNDPLKFETEMLRILRDHKIDIIALAGYMKKLPEAVIEKYKGRILNVHPALLPEFGGSGMFGLHVHSAVIEARKKYPELQFISSKERMIPAKLFCRNPVPFTKPTRRNRLLSALKKSNIKFCQRQFK